jgi:SAM-dependent methyltransferase
MTSVEAHYKEHLARIYAWMVGGAEAAVQRGELEIEALWPELRAARQVVDLGAGFGMHAIPVARRGVRVVAIDSSARLLADLVTAAAGLPVRVAEDDLLSFPRHLAAPADALLIMGDTLTHLPDLAALQRLVELAAANLRPAGRFICSFRDYSIALTGAARFIPVRSDAERILTCFLEYGAERVNVHDLLQERTAAGWDLKVSTYRKLRLEPARLAAALESAGFGVRTEPGLSGLVRMIAVRS